MAKPEHAEKTNGIVAVSQIKAPIVAPNIPVNTLAIAPEITTRSILEEVRRSRNDGMRRGRKTPYKSPGPLIEEG